MKMQNIEEIKAFFGHDLISRVIPPVFEAVMDSEDVFCLSILGLPTARLDFQFEDELIVENSDSLIIGKTTGGDLVRYEAQSRMVTFGDTEIFLASSVSNFISQIFIVEMFWAKSVKEERLGSYRANHAKYASYLEVELLRIDPELLKKDRQYYWGGMLESIEFGIVG